MAIEGAGGEEWRSFERTDQVYDPTRWGEALAQAKRGIAAHRQRDVTVRLLDLAGRPLARRRVRVQQVNSDFLWGYCGWGLLNQITDGSFDLPENQRQRRLHTDLFNAINLMHYWVERHAHGGPMSEELQGFPRYDDLDRAVTWARGEGLYTKGHPLFWPVPKAIPQWLDRYDAETRRKFLEIRIRTLTARFKGRMTTYDAVNEMMWEPAFANTAQRHWPHLEDITEIARDAGDVLRWARDEDPDAVYILNEYGIDHGSREDIPIATNVGGFVSRHRQLERYVELLRRLVDGGGAPDGAGIQTPHAEWAFHHGSQVSTYDAIAATGLPVHVTEYRVSRDPWLKAGIAEAEATERFAEYVENYLTIAFGHPALRAFFFWGGCEMFDKKGDPTPVYKRVQRLLRQTWRSSVEAVTGDQGEVSFRGFTGDYSLRLERAGGQPSGHRFTVAPGRQRLDQEIVTVG